MLVVLILSVPFVLRTNRDPRRSHYLQHVEQCELSRSFWLTEHITITRVTVVSVASFFRTNSSVNCLRAMCIRSSSQDVRHGERTCPL